MSEAEAKAAWLAKQEVPSWGPSESGWSQMTKEQAKQKWLAASEENAAVLDRLRERYTRDRAPEVPAWEDTAVVAEADTRDTAPEVQMTEDAAKAAWLASNAPAWGPSAGKMSEEEARQQWLAKMDAPAWGPSAPALEVTESVKALAVTSPFGDTDTAAFTRWPFNFGS